MTVRSNDRFRIGFTFGAGYEILRLERRCGLLRGIRCIESDEGSAAARALDLFTTIISYGDLIPVLVFTSASFF